MNLGDIRLETDYNVKTKEVKVNESVVTQDDINDFNISIVDDIKRRLTILDNLAPRWLEDNADKFTLHQSVLDVIKEKQELRAKL